MQHADSDGIGCLLLLDTWPTRDDRTNVTCGYLVV